MSVEASSSLTRVDTGLANTQPKVPEPDAEIQAIVGSGKIGRFVVLRKLGEGGMGVVFAAYDDELERKVAIKLLHTTFSGQQQTLGQQRLRREAQAMARLSHPNVAQIYEVGDIGSAVFIAMEFISGCNLREWLRQAERPWRTILDAYMQAGRGLVAAHAAGIIHRDFKPDNVLIGDDGRVRVLDFGLARPDASASESLSSTTTSGVFHSVELTQLGSFVGTPAYMAPEQLLRQPADAQSDQFGFCVALFEALYSYRPFIGADAAELTQNVVHGRLIDPPRDSDVPGWVHQVLLRGLAVAPDERYPDMAALLQALADDPAIARRRRLGVAGIVLAAGLAGGGGYAINELRAEPAPTCSGGEERLVGVWDPASSERVHAALTGAATAYAEYVATQVDARLGSYATAWSAMHRDACETHQRGEQSDALYDLRMACLDDRRTALGALVEVLAAADASVVEKAVQAADRLPLLGRCADASALLAQVPPPDDPQVARAVEAIEVKLAQAQARYEVGQNDAALRETQPLRSEAEGLGYGPTLAKALRLEGLIQDMLAEYGASEAALLRAATTADGAGDDDGRAAATTDLVRAVGVRYARFDEGLRMAELARGSISRLPDRRAHEARLETRVGEILLQRRDFEAAERHIDRAMQLHAELYGEASTVYATALNARATLHFLGARWPEALKEYQRVAAIYEQAYGPNHPLLGNVLNNIGAVQLSQFDYAAAESTYTRALEIMRAAHGPNHPALAMVYSNLGMIALAQAQFPRAIEELRRALAVSEASLPANHPDIGDALLELGNGYLTAGQHAEAEQTYARALAVYLQSFGAGHERAALALARLGMAQLRDGRPGEALLSFQRALTEFRGDPGDPVLGFPRAGLGQLRLAEGDHAAAATELEAALERLGRSPTAGPHDLAEVQFALARALLARDATSATRARSLAIEARAGFLQFGAAHAGAVAEIDAWTARLPAGP